MRYDICLFDLDGTLTDPKDGITNAIQYTLAAFGRASENPDSLTRFIGPPLRDTFAELNFPDVEKAVAKYREYYAVTGIFENTVYAGMPETLRKLKNDGKILAVVTNKVTEYTKRILKHYSLDEYFSFVSGDTMEGTLAKNGKQVLINIALDELDPKCKLNAVMVGDRKLDVNGAREAGVDSIGVMWGYGSREELETAGATRVAGTPEALYKIIAG